MRWSHVIRLIETDSSVLLEGDKRCKRCKSKGDKYKYVVYSVEGIKELRANSIAMRKGSANCAYYR